MRAHAADMLEHTFVLRRRIDASVGATPLHNGAAFVGDWSCDGGMCELDEELAGSFCPEGPLTNATAECTYFGLVNSARRGAPR